MNLQPVQNPEAAGPCRVLVLGGGIMQSADRILPFIQQYVSQYAWTPWGKVEVRAAVLGNEAALVGAVPLITGGAA